MCVHYQPGGANSTIKDTLQAKSQLPPFSFQIPSSTPEADVFVPVTVFPFSFFYTPTSSAAVSQQPPHSVYWPPNTEHTSDSNLTSSEAAASVEGGFSSFPVVCTIGTVLLGSSLNDPPFCLLTESEGFSPVRAFLAVVGVVREVPQKNQARAGIVTARVIGSLFFGLVLRYSFLGFFR